MPVPAQPAARGGFELAIHKMIKKVNREISGQFFARRSTPNRSADNAGNRPGAPVSRALTFQ
jgi:hypothetical protein